LEGEKGKKKFWIRGGSSGRGGNPFTGGELGDGLEVVEKRAGQEEEMGVGVKMDGGGLKKGLYLWGRVYERSQRTTICLK